jgi:hypothetical protein
LFARKRITISNLAFIVRSIIQKASNALEVLKEVLDAVDSQNVPFFPSILSLVLECFSAYLYQSHFHVSHDPTSIHIGSTSIFDFLFGLEPFKHKTINFLQYVIIKLWYFQAFCLIVSILNNILYYMM